MPSKRVHATRRHTKVYSGAIAKPGREHVDFLSDLPADLSTTIIDRLSERELRCLPKISYRWSALFTRTDTQSHFRSLVRSRFGLNCKPRDAQSWGSLYLWLRRERCHLCPNPNVAPFVYAGSTSLSVMLFPQKTAGLTLFPICRSCFSHLLSSHNDPFVPVVEHAELEFVFPGISPELARTALVQIGFLYTDIPLIKQRNVNGIRYTLAKPLSFETSFPTTSRTTEQS